MANDYYTGLPTIEKAPQSVDPSLFAGSLTAALDAASKQTGVSIQMSNRADSELRAAQEKAKREAEARAEQQQRDLENAANIRAQTAYQEETTKYLTRVQEDAKKSGNLVSPEQIEYDIKQIGSKYTKVFKSQTGKASFEDMVSKTALNSSGQAAAMNDRVVKEQALTSLAYIQDDAAKKMIQSPDRANEILLESQQRLSQLPLSKELKFEADLKLQQGFGDFYLQNLAGTNTKEFLRTFKDFDRPATPEGLKRALNIAYTAEEKRRETLNDAIKLMAKNTLSDNETQAKYEEKFTEEFNKAASKRNDEIVKNIENVVEIGKLGKSTGVKKDREAAEGALGFILGFDVSQAVGSPQATQAVLEKAKELGVRALPESFYNVITAGAKAQDAVGVAVGFQMYSQIQQDPALKNMLLEIPYEDRAKYEMYRNTIGTDPQSRFDAWNKAMLTPETKAKVPSKVFDLLQDNEVISIADDALNMNQWFRFGEDDDRYLAVKLDVEMELNKQLNSGRRNPDEIRTTIVESLKDKYQEVTMNGELTLVRKGHASLPDNVDKFLEPQLKSLAQQNPDVFSGITEFTKDKVGLLTGNRPVVDYSYTAAPIKNDKGEVVAHGFFTMSKDGVELTAPDELGIPRPLVVYNYDMSKYKELELMVKNQKAVDSIEAHRKALEVIFGKL